METPLLIILDTIADLKAIAPVNRMHALLVSKNTLGDNLGGFYRWDNTMTGAEDTVFMNVITSNLSTAGRWYRVFQKARYTGGGTLVNNGGVKVFYIQGTTNTSGTITLMLTEDQTDAGANLFNEIWSISVSPVSEATGPSSAVQYYRTTPAANIKNPAFGFYKANAVTVTLGLLFTPVAAVGAGIVVQFRVEGI